MAQTLNEIKRLLAEHGLYPKHRYGQNFLHDGNHMGRIMDAASLSAGDRVLEVGPGTGALTERLLDAGAEVVAVEIDSDLEPVLRERVGERERFQLIVGDVLGGKHALNPAVVAALTNQPFKLIANLPYNVASPLLVNLALLEHPQSVMTDAVVMLQKEVADRLTAGPGGKDYGPLGIILQAAYTMQTVGVLSPGCFWPAPKVSSATVALHRRAEPVAADLTGFAEFVHVLFGKRRKQLGAILGRQRAWPAGISPADRPETLSLEQIASLRDRPD